MKRLIIALVGACFVLIGVNGLAWSAMVDVNPKANTVALTFDDGPSPKYTLKILSILKKNHIKATFFVLGTKAKRYPKLL